MPNQKSNPTRDEVLTKFEYQGDRGLLVHKTSSGRHKAGTPAGSINAAGYRNVGLNGRLYYAHQMVWLCETGVWPTATVDHRDNDKDNNKFSNLRLATLSEQNQNKQKLQSNNPLGVVGVSRHNGQFLAKIGINRKQIRLGLFPTIEAASAAYRTAKQQLHPFYAGAA